MEAFNTRTAAEEHNALRAMAREIRALLEGRPCACGRERCAECLGRSVGALADRLFAHFDSEEESWRGSDAARKDRTTREWIDRLVREHAAIRERMRRVSTALEECRTSGGETTADHRIKLTTVLDDLVDHELSEVRLFQRAVFEGWSRPD